MAAGEACVGLLQGYIVGNVGNVGAKGLMELGCSSIGSQDHVGERFLAWLKISLLFQVRTPCRFQHRPMEIAVGILVEPHRLNIELKKI